MIIAGPVTGAIAGWQTPGEIQAPLPADQWQVPGEIQVPKGIQAVKAVEEGKCLRRVTVVGDALFDFDKADLRRDAEVTLAAAAPEITKAGKGSIVVNGHTDWVGGDAYNARLSEDRARTVRDWLAGKGFVSAETPIKGYGEKQPVAANANPDGSDNPEGRQKNRRVEIDIDVCE